jgi:hypothetical protein
MSVRLSTAKAQRRGHLSTRTLGPEFQISATGDELAENIESLVLEHLRPIRSKVDKLADDMETLKLRMQSHAERLISVERAVVNVHADIALVNVRLDRLETRFACVARRLDLIEEP